MLASRHHLQTIVGMNVGGRGHDDQIDIVGRGQRLCRGQDADIPTVLAGLIAARRVQVAHGPQVQPRGVADAKAMQPAHRRGVAQDAHPQWPWI